MRVLVRGEVSLVSAKVGEECAVSVENLPCETLDWLDHEGSDAVAVLLERLAEDIQLAVLDQLLRRGRERTNVGQMLAEVCDRSAIV